MTAPNSSLNDPKCLKCIKRGIDCVVGKHDRCAPCVGSHKKCEFGESLRPLVSSSHSDHIIATTKRKAPPAPTAPRKAARRAETRLAEAGKTVHHAIEIEATTGNDGGSSGESEVEVEEVAAPSKSFRPFKGLPA